MFDLCEVLALAGRLMSLDRTCLIGQRSPSTGQPFALKFNHGPRRSRPPSTQSPHSAPHYYCPSSLPSSTFRGSVSPQSLPLPSYRSSYTLWRVGRCVPPTHRRHLVLLPTCRLHAFVARRSFGFWLPPLRWLCSQRRCSVPQGNPVKMTRPSVNSISSEIASLAHNK